jgi:hypothetical protein
MALNLATIDDQTTKKRYEVGTKTKDDLERVHKYYIEMKPEWDFLLASYEGTKALLDWGVIARHERESWDNYTRRKSEAYGFDYSRSVIELFNFYMFKNPLRRELGGLGDDELWETFEKDCNLEGDHLDTFIMEQARYADVLGHIGVLCDKPNVTLVTRSEEVESGAYPYFVAYRPQNILDWEFERGSDGRRRLIFLKLLDDEGFYRLWYQDHWEVWEIPESDATTDTGSVKLQGEPTLIEDGANELGEIPFVWMYCEKSTKRQIGRSDITNIARIDAGIIRNLSQGEEVINYAAFPMMRKPYREPGQTVEGDDDSGVTAILGFDPDKPESKADWLEAKVKEPIDAILSWLVRKIEEIYRSSNIGGLAATEIQRQAKSGVALKTEFQLLNGKLIKKSENVVKATRKLLYYWTKWQGIDDKEINIERPKTFEVDNLASDLENALTSRTIVDGSTTFAKQLQKMVARLILPTADDQTLDDIDKEIEDYEIGFSSNREDVDDYLEDAAKEEDEED